MSRDKDNHLSPEELDWLAAEAGFAPPSAAPGWDRESAYAHAADCTRCGPRFQVLRSAHMSFRSLVSPVASERKSVCPAESKWFRLAAGLVSASEARSLLDHAAMCDHCGPLLREATGDLDPKISEQEQESIRQLPSVLPSWQRDVARRMAEMSGAVPTEGVTSGEESRPRAAWRFANWTWWAAPLTAAAIVAVGAAVWVERRSPSLSSTNQLIAQAYSEERPIELRFPDASYGPVRQERGESGPSRSRLDEPPELLEAETRIARGLARHPEDAGWLQAKARASVFEGQYQSAIEALQQAEAVRPDYVSLKIDLAAAYFERAGTRRDVAEQAAEYELALQSLNEVLGKNPNDLVALFNRAVVYGQQKKYSKAIADWKHYLQLDATGEWAEEARKNLDRVTSAGR